MKKQVSFDSSPLSLRIDDCEDTIETLISQDQDADDDTLHDDVEIRSYQRDLLEFYKEKGLKKKAEVPLIPTLDVIPPKPGSNRLSRSKQTLSIADVCYSELSILIK